PPSFAGVTVGPVHDFMPGGAILCTAFENSDLRNVNLTLNQATTPGCETNPLFPGSTVRVSYIDHVREASAVKLESLANTTFLVSTSDRSVFAQVLQRAQYGPLLSGS